jgi:hypothetical protein
MAIFPITSVRACAVNLWSLLCCTEESSVLIHTPSPPALLKSSPGANAR